MKSGKKGIRISLAIGVIQCGLLGETMGQFVEPAVPEGWVYYHDLAIGSVGNVTLSMELVAPDVEPDEPLPVLVFIHGGGWNHGNKDDHAKRITGYAARGYVGASVTYRFAPGYTYPSQVEDVLAAIRFLKAHAAIYHLDPERINLWGSSAGGHLASMVGTTANDVTYNTNGLWETESGSVQSVVDFSGPNSNFLSSFGQNSSSLTAFLGGVSTSIPEVAEEAMPITHVDDGDPPFFVAHGNADTTVPVEWSRDFVDALQSAGGTVTYHEFEGAAHNITATHPEAQDLAFGFLKELNFPGENAFPEYGYWAGYPIVDVVEEYQLVDTQAFMGSIWFNADWGYCERLDGWLYLPESHVRTNGAWAFKLK